MFTSNFHCHSVFSDGKNGLEDLVKSALDLGLSKLGFSDHAPIAIDSPCNMKSSVFNNYLFEINSLKEKYGNKIELFSGLEIDWLESLFDVNYNKNFSVDFNIGSVHFIKVDNLFFPVDESPEKQAELVKNHFSGDYLLFIKKYFQTYCEMVEKMDVTFFGHIDLFKKFNRGNKLFENSSKKIINWATEAIEVIAQREMTLEVNVGGISRGWIDEPYPSISILKKCKEKNLKLILTSDAHNAEKLVENFNIGLEAIKMAGYKGVEEKTLIPFIIE